MSSLREVTFVITNLQGLAYKGLDAWQCRDISSLGIVSTSSTKAGALGLANKIAEEVLREDPTCNQEWWNEETTSADEVLKQSFLVSDDGSVASLTGPEGMLEEVWEAAGSLPGTGDIQGGPAMKEERVAGAGVPKSPEGDVQGDVQGGPAMKEKRVAGAGVSKSPEELVVLCLCNGRKGVAKDFLRTVSAKRLR